jgi:hypothetical protein
VIVSGGNNRRYRFCVRITRVVITQGIYLTIKAIANEWSNMRFFDRLARMMGKSNHVPMIKMGRYSDAYKHPGNYAAWESALALFDEGKYLDAYSRFLEYLRDPVEDNVRYSCNEETVHFELFQGSKRVIGTAGAHKVRVEAKIARPQELLVGLMHSLVEKNYALKFCRFALDGDGDVCIIFDSFTLDGSPYKLYHALKELASNADKLDDLLLDEFSRLQKISDAPIEEIPLAEKEVKYRFVVGEIQKIKAAMEDGPVNKSQYPGAYAYLLLHLMYKLDYLTEPQGVMMETLERMHRIFFSSDGKSPIEKNRILDKELDGLVARTRDLYFKEMYNVRCTFGITTPVHHERIVHFIEAELPNMDWYLDNGHEAIALAIPGYIVGYSLFNYAPPRPVKNLLQLFYAVTEPKYFADLGYTFVFYSPDTRVLHARAIKKAVAQIIEENRIAFPKLRAASDSLNFVSLSAFAKSFLLMIKDLQGL